MRLLRFPVFEYPNKVRIATFSAWKTFPADPAEADPGTGEPDPMLAYQSVILVCPSWPEIVPRPVITKDWE